MESFLQKHLQSTHVYIRDSIQQVIREVVGDGFGLPPPHMERIEKIYFLFNEYVQLRYHI